jgi:hypothetical protein
MLPFEKGLRAMRFWPDAAGSPITGREEWLKARLNTTP